MNEQHAQTYLQRIGINTLPTANFDNLRHLQQQHLYHVPFENLDIHRSVPIVLDPALLFDKIVHRQRGGYCYELNGLFYDLLKALGYQTYMVSAQVHQHDNVFGKPFDHLALLVQIEHQQWLVDVGFGAFAHQPLSLTQREIQQDVHGAYRVTVQDKRYLISKDNNPVYLLDPTARDLADFAPMNQYQQTSPDVFFTQRRLISRATPDGRITLSDKTLTIRESNRCDETDVADNSTFEQYLRRYFPAVYADLASGSY